MSFSVNFKVHPFSFSHQAIGGNVMTASPISDLNPILMAARCRLTLASAGGKVADNQINVVFVLSHYKTIPGEETRHSDMTKSYIHDIQAYCVLNKVVFLPCTSH